MPGAGGGRPRRSGPELFRQFFDCCTGGPGGRCRAAACGAAGPAGAAAGECGGGGGLGAAGGTSFELKIDAMKIKIK